MNPRVAVPPPEATPRGGPGQELVSTPADTYSATAPATPSGSRAAGPTGPSASPGTAAASTAPAGSNQPVSANAPTAAAGRLPSATAIRDAGAVASAAAGSLVGSPGVGMAEADALRRLGELELGDMTGARQDLDLVLRLRGQGESLEQALAAFEDVKKRIYPHEDADARDAFLFVRTELAATAPDATEPLPRLQEMYLELLGRTHAQPEAREGWETVIASTRRVDGRETLPELFSSFMALLAAERGDVDQARKALREVLSESSTTTDPLQVRVEQYARLAETVGPRFTEDEMDGADVFHFFRRLPEESRQAFMDLQETTRNVEISMGVWERTGQARIGEPQGVRLFRGLLESEKTRLPDRSSSTMLRDVREQFDVVLTWQRPGESLEDAAAELQAVRRCLHGGSEIRAGAEGFAFLRESVKPEHKGLFLDLLTHGNSVEETRKAWEGNARASGFSTFENRLRSYLAMPVDRWSAMDLVLDDVPAAVPAGVDGDRGGLALLPVLALDEGADAVGTVCRHLDAAPSGSAGTPDARTERLEWLSRLMIHAESSSSLDRAMQATEGPSQVSHEDRTALMASLLEVTPFAHEPWEAAVDIVERLARLDATAFAEAAPELSGLARILPEGLAGTRDALVGVLAEADSSPEAVKPSPTKLLIRFAELYATTRSVPGALQILHKEARAPRGVEKDGDWVIVGGVRVPRRTAVAMGWNMQALMASGIFSLQDPTVQEG